MNIFKNECAKYLEKGYSVIPDKFKQKRPLISGWNDYCDKVPTKDDIEKWIKYAEEKGGANIAICLGSASGVIALDFDCDDPEITKKIEALLPESPVEKVSSKKGRWTRFFRYTGEASEVLKDANGNVVLEVLSKNKKTTLPPSIHPNGASYRWSKKDLLEVDPHNLPAFPPFLIAELTRILGGKDSSYGKVSNGRNNALSTKLGQLLEETKSLDEVIKELIEYDESEHEVPYFSDPNEHRHTDKVSNALFFYSTHLQSINSRRFKENKEYLNPGIVTANVEAIRELAEKKPLSKESLKKSKAEYILADSAIGKIHETILKNSWIPQPELALGAILALGAVLTSRKFVFQGMSPNLYICGVSQSGTGKDYPMQFVKSTLVNMGKTGLLGSGDYVSDASLMDSLGASPVRLDIMDEMGGILKTFNSGKSEFNSKMADILAELYTSSNSKFLGRSTAEGNKGACDRPNVSILGATTPTGFREGVSKAAIQKGLMGRFLLFFGNPKLKANMATKQVELPEEVTDQLEFLANFSPDRQGVIMEGKPQYFKTLSADDDAQNRLKEIFEEFDDLRVKNIHEHSAPVIARLYQQMIKLVMIHALLNAHKKIPVISRQDVEFGYNIIKAYFEEIEQVISSLIFDSQIEEDRHCLVEAIKELGGSATKMELYKKISKFTKTQRDKLISDCLDCDLIYVTGVKDVGQVFYLKEA